MDGIQPYAGRTPPRPPSIPPVAHGRRTSPRRSQRSTRPAKTPADYLRAIQRRTWLVVSIGMLVSVRRVARPANAAVYRAVAEVTIEPPSYDQFLAGIISKTERGLVRTSAEEMEKYVPDRLASFDRKALIDKVVPRPEPDRRASDRPTRRPIRRSSARTSIRENLPGTQLLHDLSRRAATRSKVTETLSSSPRGISESRSNRKHGRHSTESKRHASLRSNSSMKN